jgi:hypothetical protein
MNSDNVNVTLDYSIHGEWILIDKLIFCSTFCVFYYQLIFVLLILEYSQYGKWKRDNNFSYLFGANVKYVSYNTNLCGPVTIASIRKPGRKHCVIVERWE